MLKFFRNQKNSWFMKSVMILTLLSFVSLFGATSFIETIPDEGKPIVKLAGNKITVAEFVNEIDSQARLFSKVMQKPVSRKEIIDMGMLLPIFNQMVSRMTLQATTKDLKLEVSEQNVRDTIANMPQFMDYDGNFSMAAYKQNLSETGKTEGEFIDNTFLSLKTSQIDAAAAVDSKVSTEIAKLAYQIENEKRTVDLFTITPTKLSVVGNPSKQEKEKLYDEMSDDLIAPEYRSFTVLSLTLPEVAKKIKISEDELREIYEDTKDSYAKEEIRDIDQMLFSTKEEADEAYTLLKSGKNFLNVAKEFANQTAEQTQLGEMTPSTATGDWADLAFSAKKGEIIPPVQTAFGWQILRVNTITPKVQKSYAQVRNQIKEKYINSVAFDTLMETSIALDDRFGAGETIESVSESTGYKTKTYRNVDTSGKFENGKDSGLSKTLLSTVFYGELDEVSPMTEEENTFFVVRVDDIIDPALKSMQKADKELVAAWKLEKQEQKAKDIALKIENDLKKGNNPVTIAKKYGVKYTQLKDITKSDAQLPISATYSVFSKPVKSVISAQSDNALVIAKVTKIKPANPDENVIEVTNLKREMSETLAKEKTEAFLADYGVNLGLEVKEETFSKILSYLTQASAQEEE